MFCALFLQHCSTDWKNATNESFPYVFPNILIQTLTWKAHFLLVCTVFVAVKLCRTSTRLQSKTWSQQSQFFTQTVSLNNRSFCFPCCHPVTPIRDSLEIKMKILESWRWRSAEEGGDENAGVQVESGVPPVVGKIQHLMEKRPSC